ncbi:MAG: Fe-S cluster assembly protein SufD [Bacteroidales bacterium]|nr:Fe-S cluster assembly protein SufD [Bacteroidales bacterium]
MALKNQISKEDFLAVFRDEPINTLLGTNGDNGNGLNFTTIDFPNKTEEEWRHTSINKILQHRFGLGKTVSLDKKTVDLFTIPGLDAYRLVFINGYYNPDLSDEIEKAGKLLVKSSAKVKKEHPEIFNKYYKSTDLGSENFFTTLNTAYATNGSFIYLPDNAVLDKPVHIINFSDGQDSKTISQYRNVFYAGKNSKAQIVNSFHSLTVNYTLTNVATEIIVDENAFLNFNIFQGEGDDAFQMNHTKVFQHRNSNFSSHTITLCGAIVRNDIHIKHLDEGCETNLNGLYLPDREQHFDNHIFVHHAKPHGTSNQIYKGIIDNKASAVFLGKVLVDRDAQKTLAAQSNRNVLLTKYAKVNSKPQLEIYADDVACSHGSTTGQIDKEALFYLQSRGIDRRNAETLLLSAFLSDVIENIQVEPLKILVKLLINKRLKGEKVEGQCSMIEACHGCDPID